VVNGPLELTDQTGRQDRAALIEAIRQDTMGRPGDRAMIRFTLSTAWQGREKDQSLAEVDALADGVERALGNKAEDVRKSLSENEGDLLFQVFVRLARSGEPGGATAQLAANDLPGAVILAKALEIKRKPPLPWARADCCLPRKVSPFGFSRARRYLHSCTATVCGFTKAYLALRSDAETTSQVFRRLPTAELFPSVHCLSSVHQRRATAHVNRHPQHFLELLSCGAETHEAFCVEANASIAAQRNCYAHGDQLFGLFVQRGRRSGALSHRGETFHRVGNAFSQLPDLIGNRIGQFGV
jgi:hypothetical protein